MSTVVDKMVEHGIPRDLAENYVLAVFQISPTYTYAMWLECYPLADVPSMVELANMIRDKQAEIDKILRKDDADMVRWLLLTGHPLPNKNASRKRVHNAMNCVVSTNPFFV